MYVRTLCTERTKNNLSIFTLKTRCISLGAVAKEDGGNSLMDAEFGIVYLYLSIQQR